MRLFAIFRECAVHEDRFADPERAHGISGAPNVPVGRLRAGSPARRPTMGQGQLPPAPANAGASYGDAPPGLFVRAANLGPGACGDQRASKHRQRCSLWWQ